MKIFKIISKNNKSSNKNVKDPAIRAVPRTFFLSVFSFRLLTIRKLLIY